jgi:hypothetical protein
MRRPSPGEACIEIANEHRQNWIPPERGRLAYTRASEILAPFKITIDIASREYAAALAILGGKASISI